MAKKNLLLIVMLLAAMPLWSQDNAPETPVIPEGNDDMRMTVPPPVSAESYPEVVGSDERSNYLRTGVTFTTTYDDNVLGGQSSRPVGDESYSVWPYLSLDETTSRLHSQFTVTPGFTYYQHTSGRNEADGSADVDVSYRLTRHTTLSLVDSFSRMSNVLNQPGVNGNASFGVAQASPVTVYAPVADQIRNVGTAQLTHQFAPNGMFGFSGTFSNLHYPDTSEVPGLFDSTSRSGSAFYNHRLSGRHYVGVTYQYQQILAYPTGFQSETQTHGVMLYYTFYFQPKVSLSFFGGPQYSNTQESIFPAAHAWSPAAGASLSWQGRSTNIVLSYSRIIAPGGGLSGAVHQNGASTSLQHKLTRNLGMGISAGYSNFNVLNPIPFLSQGPSNGHTLSATGSLQRQLGERFSVSVDYSRLHQSYSGIAAISPDTNQGRISLSYNFSRPIGR
ncbi:MAG TPA: hypothetical protein VJ731_16190 [Terriglobales bacterium]|nr:hypothetical protein [Terriglobales bacterium]